MNVDMCDHCEAIIPTGYAYRIVNVYDEDDTDFCGWVCLAKYANAKRHDEVMR